MLINILQWGAMVVDSMQVRGAVLSDQQGWRIREIIIVVVVKQQQDQGVVRTDFRVFDEDEIGEIIDFRKYVIGPSIFLENTTWRILDGECFGDC